ncbi:MAG: TPM domain-containing protein [Eubacteriales bacterium]|nr:TPM domain-containing protein [Eubacteriales bacterium]
MKKHGLRTLNCTDKSQTFMTGTKMKVCLKTPVLSIALAFYMSILLLVILTGAFSVSVSAEALIPDPLPGFYVNDFADVIDEAAERYIMLEAEKLEEATTAQVVVVTLDSLDGEALEEYSTELFRKWGIGSSKDNNGVLILLDKGGRQSRIEVGYGLEGALPDGRTGRIQDESMIPFFRNGDYSGGILEGFKSIIPIVYTEYGFSRLADGAWEKDGQTVPAATAEVKIPLPGQAETGPYPVNGGGSPFSSTLIIIIAVIFIILDFRFFGGNITLTLLRVLISFGRWGGGGRSGGGSIGSSRSGGGGFSGGGGSSRRSSFLGSGIDNSGLTGRTYSRPSGSSRIRTAVGRTSSGSTGRVSGGHSRSAGHSGGGGRSGGGGSSRGF